MKYNKWLQYFLSNKEHFDHIDWYDQYNLNNSERHLIANSIKQFQLGEHSEGKHFLRYAASLNDEQYTETVKLFIKEEQDHAAVLGRFMDIQGIKKMQKD